MNPFSETPVTPAGRARSPAAGASSGALPSYSPHPTCPPRAAPPSLSLGRSFSQQVFHVSSVLSASLPHDRGSTFPVSHLSGKQAASPTVLHAHEHTCAQVKGWSTGRRGAIGSLGIRPGYNSPGSKGPLLLREEERVRASTGFIRARVPPPRPRFQTHPSPNPCSA